MEILGNLSKSEIEAAKYINSVAYNFESPSQLDPLMELIGNAKYVLLGEASHGTHEYYTWRAHLSKRLITEKKFSFIAVEGDWPDCFRINRYVKNYPDAGSNAKDVLQAFNRWPSWMWANWEVAALIDWMRQHNEQLPANRKAGFYGLDVYSLWESMDAMSSYLEKHDKSALKLLNKVTECFDPFGRNEGSSYGHAAESGSYSCENDVVNMLEHIRRKLPMYNSDHEAVFSTEQNALIAVNAEHYYRTMLKGSSESWNIRDNHMMETLNRLMKFHGNDAKCIVWEHNTHIGDARATDMARHGMFNIGQLAMEEHEKSGVVRIGFGSYKGSVIAGRRWGAQMRSVLVPEAMEGSFENLLHNTGRENKILISADLAKHNYFKKPIGHRAIGVVYNPEHERYGNYVPSIIPERYEAFVFIDETRALHPMHVFTDAHQTPETYPFGV